MEETPRLYSALEALLGQHGRWKDQRHLYPMIWMVIGLLASGQISLTAWGDYVQSRAVYAQSTQRRFSRWLSNARIEEHRVYAGLIRYALSVWQQERIVIAIDTTRLWERYCVIRVAVVYRGRGIPVVWSVLEHSSSMVAYSTYAGLLDASGAVLPQGVEVLLLADRGFADVELFKHLRRLGWHYRIRVKSNFLVYRGKQGTPISFY
ncbi:MAG: transposase, partial [Leptolyngbyaceae cyanobacterium RU_5_1]|nr:transposase [Leptolyngbyaceae cyanobacterium RU_5_1]